MRDAKDTAAQHQAGVLFVRSDGVVDFANQRLGALLGLDVGRFAGRARFGEVAALINARFSDPDAFSRSLFEFYQAPEGYELSEWETADGRVLRRFGSAVYGVPIYGAGRERPGRVEVYTDITANAAAADASDIERVRVVHELRAPIASLRATAQLALIRLREGADRQKIEPLLPRMIEEVDRLAQLVDTLAAKKPDA